MSRNRRYTGPLVQSRRCCSAAWRKDRSRNPNQSFCNHNPYPRTRTSSQRSNTDSCSQVAGRGRWRNSTSQTNNCIAWLRRCSPALAANIGSCSRAPDWDSPNTASCSSYYTRTFASRTYKTGLCRCKTMNGQALVRGNLRIPIPRSCRSKSWFHSRRSGLDHYIPLSEPAVWRGILCTAIVLGCYTGIPSVRKRIAIRYHYKHRCSRVPSLGMYCNPNQRWCSGIVRFHRSMMHQARCRNCCPPVVALDRRSNPTCLGSTSIVNRRRCRPNPHQCNRCCFWVGSWDTLGRRLRFLPSLPRPKHLKSQRRRLLRHFLTNRQYLLHRFLRYRPHRPRLPRNHRFPTIHRWHHPNRPNLPNHRSRPRIHPPPRR